MELFQIKITNEGKLLEQTSGNFSLVDEGKSFARTIK